jgi:hypothetical protein
VQSLVSWLVDGEGETSISLPQISVLFLHGRPLELSKGQVPGMQEGVTTKESYAQAGVVGRREVDRRFVYCVAVVFLFRPKVSGLSGQSR